MSDAAVLTIIGLVMTFMVTVIGAALKSISAFSRLEGRVTALDEKVDAVKADCRERFEDLKHEVREGREDVRTIAQHQGVILAAVNPTTKQEWLDQMKPERSGEGETS